jgi:hypothetical protein
MFARLPPSSSDLTERKALFRHLLLQVGGANIEKLVPSSLFAKRARGAPSTLAERVVGSLIQSVAQPACAVCRTLYCAPDRFL